MNWTLSIDKRTVCEARLVVKSMGKSLNQLIREHLQRLMALDDAQSDIEEFKRLSDLPQGDSRGWRFDRDELHERS